MVISPVNHRYGIYESSYSTRRMPAIPKALTPVVGEGCFSQPRAFQTSSPSGTIRLLFTAMGWFVRCLYFRV